MSKVLTLRLLEPGARPKRDDYRLTAPSAFDGDEGPFYRKVDPVPGGYVSHVV